MKKSILLSAILALFISLTACQFNSSSITQTFDREIPGQGVTVKMGTGPIFFGRFITEIVGLGLRELGYQTREIKQLKPSLAHVAVGNGDLDFSTVHLEKSHQEFFVKGGGDAKLERVGTIVPQILEGYQIDLKTAQDYEITNLEQLKNPQIARLFDSDGDGKANLAGCDVGRACERTIDYHLEAYELIDTIEHDKGQNEILMADVISRYQQGKSVLYYTSQPSAIDFELKTGEDTTWLSVPFTALPPAQQQWTGEDTSLDGQNLGFLINRIRILANKIFLETNPAAKTWLEQVQIPTDDIRTEAQLLQQGENRPNDIRRHAQKWIENHKQKVDYWLETARKAASIESPPSSNKLS
ncbi:glycine betaine/L-proline ABC transporter substrate-binding protein ProX [Oscillatoriales cyanobacterium LEGE 11467]|uniref:Glycine betaine/L-proline ABC transporter substrate-binding protein ProX n=1 Tax=Zarconia navalis LEGE 11467 TaxID=1828826 RepID=A0A928VSS4_9CYAN|nr:glycine betaine/L-proline ABC transporter substrate-binding protein ProX [Zarconia navalis]MBE9039471.1 glycine betaine/L-proline ABC transporter substrate-binding protein ProX [Zarconia navalis LEGE 11467]